MKRKLTMGSLFDGSGGFPLASVLAGITPVWASEIEPFPIRVTTKRLPNMKHYGDVSSLRGGDLPAVDIITFGSPCQDLSVAGKRAGLTGGERSSLFFQAVRIIKEMREATDGLYPTFAVWENVPGALSSNGGEDFRRVLEEFAHIRDEFVSIPRPADGRWNDAGEIVADGWSLAWRVLDAQYWGVPQRRRRIFLVADFGGQRAGRILFERESVLGHPFAGNAERKEAPAGTGRRADETGGVAIGFYPQMKAESMCITEETQPCLVNGTNPGFQNGVMVPENHSADSRVTASVDGKVQTLTSRMGTGGNNVPLVMKIRCGCEGGGKGPLIQTDKSATLATNNDQTLFVPAALGICSRDSNAMKSDNPNSGFYKADTTRTLDANGGNPSCNQGGMAVVALEGNGARPSHKGSGFSEKGVSFTLNATEQHAVCYNGAGCEGGQTTYTLTGDHDNRVTDRSNLVATAVDCRNGTAATLTAQEKERPVVCTDGISKPTYIVRRLMPVECARLQGFPDWWCADLDTKDPTDEEIAFWEDVFETYRKIVTNSSKPKSRRQIVDWLKSPHSDAAEYKMWGNGIALPCAAFVLRGISDELKKAQI